jgi:hypothetical protein
MTQKKHHHLHAPKKKTFNGIHTTSKGNATLSQSQMNAAQYSQPCYIVLTYVVPKLTLMNPDSVYNQARNLVCTVQC